MKVRNLRGRRFGKLKVLERAGSDPKSQAAVWFCECDCGESLKVRRNHLLTGATKSCGCSRVKTKGIGSLRASYRANAKRSGRVFNLSLISFRRIVGSNCYYCGAKPSKWIIGTTAKAKERNGTFVNGIDRLDNDKGYTLKNSVPCCWRCNRWKHTMTEKQFLAHAKRIVQHSRKK